jgi:ParB/RepB/Spo0J family partition protein
MKKIDRLMLDQIVPMLEVDRQYYSPSAYQSLKRIIRKDGYDEAYPIRVLWNEKKGVYEVFDGIHRFKIVKELGLRSNIPAIDETAFLTRSMAIAKGLKANYNRSSLSPIDLALGLKALGENLTKGNRNRKKSVGRPKTFDESEIAIEMSMSVPTVSRYLQLLKLPEEVIDLIGQGKLRFRHSLILTKLLGTRYENKIPELVERVIENEMSTRQLTQVVEAIKSQGFFEGEARCDSCKRTFPSDSINRPHLCVSCMGKLHSGELDKDKIESHNESRRRYLKLMAILVKHYPNDTVPEHMKNVLEKFRRRWNGDKEPEAVPSESFMEYVQKDHVKRRGLT